MKYRGARFCDMSCASGFATDRRYGAIYSAVRTPEGSYSAEHWSLVSCTCAYCGAEVAGRAEKRGPTWAVPDWEKRAMEVQS